MATKELIDQLRALVNTLTETPIDKIINNPNWGEINFEDNKQDLEKIFSIFNSLKILPIEILPNDVIQSMITAGGPIEASLTAIKGFRVAQNDPVGQKNALTNNLRAQADNFYKISHIYIPYLAYQKGDIQRNIDALTRTVTEANTLVETTKTDITTKSGEIDRIITAAKEASASVGVAHFTVDFLAEASTQERSAEKWLIATAVLAALTIGAAIAFLCLNYENIDTFKLIQITTSKLIIMGTLVTATLWSGRLYKAAKHLETINKHRANSLKTFQAFVNAAFDDGTRNAVLMETTKCIFSQSSSGYIDEPGKNSDSGVRIIEVIKNSVQTVSALEKPAG